MDVTQRASFEWHLTAAAELDPQLASEVQTLARQLLDKPVVPLLGAGASFDCGVRLASPISEDLATLYATDPDFEPRENISDPADLGTVAEAIANRKGQKGAVRAIRLPEPEAWPSAEGIDGHFCLYRVLARMAREGLVEQTVGFNYDCGFEAGLDAEGFSRSPYTAHGQQWNDHAQVIADAATQSALVKPGALRVFKAHGCAHRYRQLAESDESGAAETIVLRASQLNSWRTDTWMRDAFRTLARQNILLATGFAGQDAVIAGEITAILRDVYSAVPSAGVARVIAVNHQPMTPALGALINSGLGGVEPAEGQMTRIDTSSTSTTAFALALLTEMLDLKLRGAIERVGGRLPQDGLERLLSLIVLAPVMLRWTYLLRPARDNGFIQNVNLRQAAEKGYVPLLADVATTAQTFATRAALARRLGFSDVDRAADGTAHDGFLVANGVAYLPVGLPYPELLTACRPGNPEMETLRVLPRPPLDCVLVSSTSVEHLRGVSLDSGLEVTV